MNYTTDLASYSDIVAKLPQDFCDKHPKLVLGGGILVIMLPTLYYGGKFLVKEIGINFRYWVDAKYGKPTPVILDTAETVLLDDPAVA